MNLEALPRSPANGRKPLCSLAIAGAYRNGYRVFRTKAEIEAELAVAEARYISGITTMTAAEVLAELRSGRVIGSQAKMERLIMRAERAIQS